MIFTRTASPAKHSGTVEYTVVPGRNWHGSEGTDLGAVCDNYVAVGTVTNVR